MSRDFRAILLLWLAGNALRLTILAIPPLLAVIQSDLRLSGTQVGILTSLPVVLFGIAALPGSLLIARFGALTALLIGIAVAATGGALRGLAPDVMALYAATVLMGAGVAVMQPSLPPLVREWMPDRIGFGSAVFTNGLLVGEILPVAFTASLLLPLFGSWRSGLAFWSLPMIAIAAIVLIGAPRDRTAFGGRSQVRWWPDWSDTTMWRLGLLTVGANATYFGVNTFIPGYLTFAGRPDLIGITLTALNLGQIPVSVLLIAFARFTERRIWPFVGFGLIILCSLIGLVCSASLLTVMFAGFLGFSAAGVLALGLALPGLLSAPSDIGRMAAAMFTIGYGFAVVLTVIGGALWDFAHDARFAFVPIAIGALPLVLVSPTIRFRRAAVL